MEVIKHVFLQLGWSTDFTDSPMHTLSRWLRNWKYMRFCKKFVMFAFRKDKVSCQAIQQRNDKFKSSLYVFVWDATTIIVVIKFLIIGYHIPRYSRRERMTKGTSTFSNTLVSLLVSNSISVSREQTSYVFPSLSAV